MSPSRLLTSWSLFRVRPLLKDLHQIARDLDRIATVAERAFPSESQRKPQPGSVSTSVMTMEDRAAIASAERTLTKQLGRFPTDEEVANLMEEARTHLRVLRR